jgi:hypothetical protein
MHINDSRNVQQALISGMRDMNNMGTLQDSRNGKVVSMHCPHTTIYPRS